MAEKKILVAVLNWGLGHATRSIPLIKALREQGFEPILASDGDALTLLKKEFPQLQSFVLPSYGISYPKNANLKWHFLKKSPKIIRAVWKEQKKIAKIVEQENIIGLISDNRLGAYSNRVPSVYLTHQLKVFSGKTTFFSSAIHQYFMNKFTEIWVPDLAKEPSLSGKMGHSVPLKPPITYLGLPSRFEKKNIPIKYNLMVLLSGPEPQRGFLEKKLLMELERFSGKLLFIRGKIGNGIEKRGNLEIHDFMTGKALEKAINQSHCILARSGYSTLLDLAILQKRCFFIPTPGQFEQEFLARRIQQLGIAPYCKQDDFTLKQLYRTTQFNGFSGFNSVFCRKGVFSLFEGK